MSLPDYNKLSFYLKACYTLDLHSRKIFAIYGDGSLHPTDIKAPSARIRDVVDTLRVDQLNIEQFRSVPLDH